MANLIKINPEPRFNENLYPNSSLSYTVVGAAGSTVAYNDFSANKDKSVKFTAVNTNITTLSLGEEITIPYSGTHALSLYLWKFNPALEWQFTIKIYKNGLLFETIGADLTNTSSGFLDGKWNIYGQTFNFTAGEIVTFQIEAVTATAGNTLYMSAPKFEFVNKGFTLPSYYTYPSNYFKNPYSGWAYYVDSLATPTISVGTSYTQITIDGLGASITDYLPKEIRGVSQLWDGSKITPISVGDDYDGRFDLTITAKTGSPSAIELIIDISGSTAGSNTAFTGWVQAIGTAPYNQSLPLDFFSLSTFLANGGKIYAKVDTGTVTIGRRNIKISRKSKSF